MSRKLVLIGGGHAHVEVLRRWAQAPVDDVELVLVVDRPKAVYSGMVPGFVAGQYAAHELEVDVASLAHRAGATLVTSAARRVDPAAQYIATDEATVPYDFASFNVGSRVAHADRPGVREFAVATRPIADLVRRIDTLSLSEGARVCVVGAGAGGVELAFALRARLTQARSVALVERGERILGDRSVRISDRVARAAAARGIEIHVRAEVERIDASALHLVGRDSLPCDLAFWVSGAGAPGLFSDSGLPVDARGFVRVRPTFQVQGHDALFAAGDCAALDASFRVPKAGVYAVRSGPVLAQNLIAALRGQRLRAFQPQRDFLSLLNLGDGSAIGSKWGMTFEGRWVMTLKDRIDRRWMARYSPLSSHA